MQIVKPPLYSDKILAKSFVWRIPNNKNKIFLTFDDGPTKEITNSIIKIISDFDIKATFFCIGRNVDRLSDIYNKIIESGNVAGNHSYSHLNGWKVKYQEYINDVELSKNIINSNLFRPPYGKIRPKQLRALKSNFKIVMWDVLSGDYNYKQSPIDVYKNVVNNVKSGSIIVFHDSDKAKKNMLYALPKAIENLLKKGFVFDVIDYNKLK